MATIQRPTKEGAVHTYQEKVALGFVDILASEMDADLDTIYAAWNGGVDSVTLKDLSVTTPKLADGAVTGPKLASNLSLTGDLTIGGTLLNLASRFRIANAGDYVDLLFNDGGSIGYDVNRSGWMVRLASAVGGDGVEFWRRPIGSASATRLFALDAGAIVRAGAIMVGGTANGVRCQNVGTAAGDGYSNNIAFGWNGSLQARVDATVIGTVTVTSDARAKRDVQEDVPGLDTVLALRPVSFEFDQSKRPIGFEQGRHYGLIAQDLEPYLPLLLREEIWDSEKPDERTLALQYFELIPVLIQAVKDLAAKVSVLEARP